MRGATGAGLLVLAAGPAQAECLGSCADSLLGVLIAFVVYGVLGIVVLVMLIRAKWRRGGVKLLLAVLLVAVGVPLASQAWAGWRLHQMQAREITGPLPDLTGKTPLLMSGSIHGCYYNTCALVLWGRGEGGTYALPLDALDGVDLSRPLTFADLPLELWQRPSGGSSDPRSRPLTAAERQTAAAAIDYLILARTTWSGDAPGPVDAALRQRPGLTGMRDAERAQLALGPITGGMLDLAGMSFDLLDLFLTQRPLALILAPYNRQDAGNTTANELAVKAQLCPDTVALDGWDCDYALR